MAEGYKDWSAGDILTAADLEDYTVKQSVMRFADSSARTTALSGVLAEGMVSYLKDTDSVQVYDGSAWAAVGGKILQVVSTTKDDTFSTSSGTFTDVTGLSVSITPTLSTSKVLVMFDIDITSGTADTVPLRLMRDSTAIGVGASAGSRLQATVVKGIGAFFREHTSAIFLDSPATTSATTYKVQLATGATLYVNRDATDTDSAALSFARSRSQITVMEVSA